MFASNCYVSAHILCLNCPPLADTKASNLEIYMGMGFPFPMGFPRESHGNGNTSMPKMGMGMERVGHVTMKM